MKNNGSNLTNNNNAGKVNTESTQPDLGSIFKSSSGTTNPTKSPQDIPTETEQSVTVKDVPVKGATDGAQSVEDAPNANNITDISTGLDIEDDPNDTPFPLHCLPDVLNNMVDAIHAAGKVDKSNTAACALGMLNTALGKGIYLEDPTGRKTYAKTAIWIGAESGTGKSTMYNPLVAPIMAYQKELQEAWSKEATVKRGRLINLKKQMNKLKGGDGEQSTFNDLQQEIEECEEFLNKYPKLIAADATDSALQNLLYGNDTQISINASEGRTIGHRMLYGGDKDCLGCQILLSILSPTGDDQSVDRSSEGGRQYTLEDNWGNSVVLIQPDLLRQILRHPEAIENGFAGRLFFPSRPVKEPKGKRRKIDPVAQQEWDNLITDALKTYRSGAHSVPIQISDKQDDWLTEYRDNISDRIESGELYPVRMIARRWTENIYKVAVLLHVAKHGVNIDTQQLDEETLHNAKEICEWFHANQLDTLAEDMEDKSRELGKRIENWIFDQEKLGELVTLKQTYDKFRIPKSEVLSCLEPYFKTHKLTQYEVQQRGRRSTFLVTQESVSKLLDQYPEARIAA